MFVYRTFERFSQISTIVDRKRGVLVWFEVIKPEKLFANAFAEIPLENFVKRNELMYQPDHSQDLFEIISTSKPTVIC